MIMRCEMSTGWALDPHGQPRIQMCGEPAKLYAGFAWCEVKLCDKHYEYMKEKKRGTEAKGQ